ncbi:hypothetical protein BpHYR1_044329 [Brachionus plicatilis]|uniref:Protein-L-isoaspartate O-methyltransferase n=1 Tax=Brachionus plicatilis TaxID=10195 RepID=A0A3M7RSX3_BRAPC|nr:hypothetical protein BpHYR1_044329 [Brachionus plicatilis]
MSYKLVSSQRVINQISKRMSWFARDNVTNDDLIKNLMNERVIKSEVVRRTMSAVDRGLFAPAHPYMDCPQPIGYGATISAPHMHAHATELLKDKLKPGAKALDIGSGTGYLCAVFALMVGKTGKVVGIEHIPQLVNRSIENIKRWNSEYLDNNVIELIVGDGRKGYVDEGPYDAIHVGASISEIPQSLIDQLAIGGRLVIPVGDEYSYQYLTKVDKQQDGSIHKEKVCAVGFVPLTDKDRQTGHTIY